jgi:hypothetical protein
MNQQHSKIWLGSILFSCLLSLTSCGDKSLRDYYYPIEDLQISPEVYVYTSLGRDSGSLNYLYLQVASDTANKKYLVEQSYGSTFEPEEFSREEILEAGTIRRESTIYWPDSTGKSLQIPVYIKQGAVFPFAVKDSNSRFLFEINWAPEPQDPYHIVHLTRNRSYVSDTTWTFNGRQVDAIKLRVREELEDKYAAQSPSIYKGSLTLRYDGYEIYARDIGLVYYRKDFDNGPPVVYQLTLRTTMAAIEEQSRKTNPNR